MEIKIGDMLWVSLKGPQNDYGYGKVIDIFLDEEGSKFFDFYCFVNGGQRTGSVKNIIEKPTGRMVGKLSQSRKEVQEVLKAKR
jgi:hypothetical protein